MLEANPPASDVDWLLFSLRNNFHQLSGGTPLSPPRPPRGQSPFGLTNAASVYARELRRALPQPPPVTEFVGMTGYHKRKIRGRSLKVGDLVLRIAQSTKDRQSSLCPGKDHTPSRRWFSQEPTDRRTATATSSPTLGTLSSYVVSSPKFNSFACFHTNAGSYNVRPEHSRPGSLGGPWEYTTTHTVTLSLLFVNHAQKGNFFRPSERATLSLEAT
jgi:hypothetical protein